MIINSPSEGQKSLEPLVDFTAIARYFYEQISDYSQISSFLNADIVRDIMTNNAFVYPVQQVLVEYRSKIKVRGVPEPKNVRMTVKEQVNLDISPNEQAKLLANCLISLNNKLLDEYEHNGYHRNFNQHGKYVTFCGNHNMPLPNDSLQKFTVGLLLSDSI